MSRRPNASATDVNKRIESFSAYKPFVLEPKDICLMGVIFIIAGRWGEYNPEFVYRALQVLLRETQDVQPSSWKDVLQEVCAVPVGMGKDGRELDIDYILPRFATTMRDPNELHKFMMEDIAKMIKTVPTPPNHPGSGQGVLRRSWLGIYLRRCRLAYRKLSEAAVQRLIKAYVFWLDERRGPYEFTLETLEKPGYLLIPTSVNEITHSRLDAYERFELERHTGNVPGAVDNLRQYFDQRFTEGRQPPRQHALNALAHYYLEAGEIESARLIGNEAQDIARTVGDRETLLNITSLMHRLPPKSPPVFHNDPHQSHLRKVLLAREGEATAKAGGKYTLMQIGTSPFDLLFDVRVGINEGEPLSVLFRKRFEAVGCLDLPPDMPGASLDTQWAIWMIDAQLWRMAGMSTVAEISDSLVLQHSSLHDDIRLHTLYAVARRHFQKGEYLQVFAILMDENTWARMNMVQYQSWSNEIWWLMMDIATRRGQDRFKREFLNSRKPLQSSFDTVKGKRSPESIRKLIIEAADALRMKNHTQATFLIIDALHYAEMNGYWYLYRSAIPIFADLELQRGKVESARRRIEEILPQVARGEDLEQRAMSYMIYAKIHMMDGLDNDASLTEAIWYLVRAEDDYRKLEMYASLQDALYLQAIVYEKLGEEVARDAASDQLRAVESIEKRVMNELDTGMIKIWDVVCQIGVAVANGDTFWS